MARFSFENHVPRISFSAWTAESSQVIGRVELKDNSSIWPGAVLRGDLESITVGVGSNVQDNAVIHTEKGFPCVVGDTVTVGHAAVLHGCTVKSGAPARFVRNLTEEEILTMHRNTAHYVEEARRFESGLRRID